MNVRSLLSLFSSDLAIDLGTANTLVYARGKGIVVNEPSIVTINRANGEVLAVGKEAKEMLGRTPGNIVAIRPMKDGVIADFKVTERMLNYFIQKAHGRKLLVHPRIVIGVPGQITQVERRAVVDSAYRANASEVYLVEQALVAAIGAFSGNGNICVGVYAFDPNEELQSCCSCLVTPDGLASLSAKAITASSLTGENPTSLVIKLLAWATTAGVSSTAAPGTPAPPTSSACNAGAPASAVVAAALHAWGTTLHALPVSGYTVTETPFSTAALSTSEFVHLTEACEFNQINGSGITGQCPGCTVGGQ